MKKLAAAVALGLLAPATPAALAAAPGCPAGARPLVEINAVATSLLSLDKAVSSGGALICTGGATVEVAVTRDAFVSPGGGLGDAMPLLPDAVVVVTGVVPAPVMAALGEALAAGGAGRARDCHLSWDGSVLAATRVTWHGRGTRRNTFTVTTDELGLPDCPPAVEAMVASVYAALLEAGSGEGATALVID